MLTSQKCPNDLDVQYPLSCSDLYVKPVSLCEPPSDHGLIMACANYKVRCRQTKCLTRCRRIHYFGYTLVSMLKYRDVTNAQTTLLTPLQGASTNVRHPSICLQGLTQTNASPSLCLQGAGTNERHSSRYLQGGSTIERHHE